MNTPSLFDLQPEPQVSETSRAQFERIRGRLPLVDLLVVRLVDDYCRETGHQDVTGRELAEHFGRDVLAVRPRLTGAFQAHWLEKADTRKSRSANERACQPYRCSVPRAATDRAIKTQEEEAR